MKDLLKHSLIGSLVYGIENEVRIRPLLLTCFGVVGALAVAASSYRGLDGVAARRVLAATSVEIDGLRLALAVGEQIARERSAANSLFAQSIPIPEQIDRDYSRAKSATDEAWARLAAHEPASVVRLKAAMSKLNSARDRAFAALAAPPGARPENANRLFVADFSDAQAAASVEADRIERAIGELSPNLGQLVGLARLSAFLREALGVRSALLSPLVGGAPIDPGTIRRMDELGGVASALWDRVRLTAAQMPDKPLVMAAVTAMSGTVMGEGEKTYRSLIDEVRLGQIPMMDLAAFRAWTIPMLRNALLVRDAAFSAAAEQRMLESRAALARIWQGLGFSTIAFATCLLASMQVMRRVARPLSSLTIAVRRIADGDLETMVPGAGRRDELGEVAAAVLTLRDRAACAEGLRAESALEQERKLLAAASTAAAAKVFEQVSCAALARVAEAEAELYSAAEKIDQATARTADEAIGAARGVDRAAASVESVAAAVKQLSIAIRHASKRMADAARSADAAALGSKAAAKSVADLSSTARQIKGILDLIGKIASRTKLLALNATIEAAQAGDAGKGFVVVAAEVKSLAVQTARAAEEVGRHVEAILFATTGTMGTIDALTKQVDWVSIRTGEVAALVEQQEAATREIARAAREAAGGTTSATGKVSAAAEETETVRAVAARLPGLASAVAGATGSLRDDVGRFLQAVRMRA